MQILEYNNISLLKNNNVSLKIFLLKELEKASFHFSFSMLQ